MPRETPRIGDSRPNTPLISMVTVGMVATLGGSVWAAFAFNALSSLQAPPIQTFAVFNIGLGVACLGMSLLIIAWIIAAARWPTRY